jgi:hypothetical protein
VQEWVTRDDLLGGHGEDFVILQIDGSALGCGVIRDPASKTGWLLDCEHVPSDLLTLVREIG